MKKNIAFILLCKYYYTMGKPMYSTMEKIWYHSENYGTLIIYGNFYGKIENKWDYLYELLWYYVEICKKKICNW